MLIPSSSLSPGPSGGQLALCGSAPPVFHIATGVLPFPWLPSYFALEAGHSEPGIIQNHMSVNTTLPLGRTGNEK